MDLPSTRELELETLLRERDAQVIQLSDEVVHLRQYLSNQPAPSTTDQITLPPPFVSLILPHINARRAGHAFGAGASSSAATSSSVTTAVLQRAKLLQDENDELYELLKHCEVSRLNEEVRGLRRVVQKLEDALKESHKAISTLSTELEKSNTTLLSSATPAGVRNSPSIPNRPSNAQWPMRNPQNGGHVPPDPPKQPPTGPRAPKKPRLSAPDRETPPHASNAGPGSEPVSAGGGHGRSGGGGGGGGGGGRRSGQRERDRTWDRKRSRSRSPRPRVGGNDGRGSDAEGRHQRTHSRSPSRDGENQTGRDRGVRERGREREKDRPPRRRGGRAARHREHSPSDLDDRTLASRMGV